MPAPEQPSPLVLSANAIINGQFYAAGSAVPYASEADLPENLKPFVATGDETPFKPSERNIYDMPPPLLRQARKLETIAAEKAWARRGFCFGRRPRVKFVLARLALPC
jgi:hypothetical protein